VALEIKILRVKVVVAPGGVPSRVILRVEALLIYTISSDKGNGFDREIIAGVLVFIGDKSPSTYCEEVVLTTNKLEAKFTLEGVEITVEELRVAPVATLLKLVTKPHAEMLEIAGIVQSKSARTPVTKARAA
jgi:hypothetical protein